MTEKSKGLPAPVGCVCLFAADDGDTNRSDQPDTLPQLAASSDDKHNNPSSRAGHGYGGEVGGWRGNGFRR